MSHLNINDLERWLADLAAKRAAGDLSQEYCYVETGRYKPYNLSTVRAAIRRGYRVESFCRGTVFYVYPKEIPPTREQRLEAALRSIVDHVEDECMSRRAIADVARAALK